MTTITNRRMRPWTKAILTILADGEWHDREDVINEAMPTVPPGIAVRETELGRRHSDPNAPAERTRPISTSDAIAAGARAKVVAALGTLRDNGRIERDGDRCRIIRDVPRLLVLRDRQGVRFYPTSDIETIEVNASTLPERSIDELLNLERKLESLARRHEGYRDALNLVNVAIVQRKFEDRVNENRHE